MGVGGPRNDDDNDNDDDGYGYREKKAYLQGSDGYGIRLQSGRYRDPVRAEYGYGGDWQWIQYYGMFIHCVTDSTRLDSTRLIVQYLTYLASFSLPSFSQRVIIPSIILKLKLKLYHYHHSHPLLFSDCRLLEISCG